MKKLELRVCHYSGHTGTLSPCSLFYCILPSKFKEERLIWNRGVWNRALWEVKLSSVAERNGENIPGVLLILNLTNRNLPHNAETTWKKKRKNSFWIVKNPCLVRRQFLSTYPFSPVLITIFVKCITLNKTQSIHTPCSKHKLGIITFPLVAT